MDVGDPFDPNWKPPVLTEEAAKPGAREPATFSALATHEAPPSSPPPPPPPPVPGTAPPAAEAATFDREALVATPGDSAENLGSVATGMKILNGAVALYLLLVVVNFLPLDGALALALGLGILVGALAVLVLALIGMGKIQGGLGKAMVVRVLSGLALFVPLVGLVVMVIVNSQGTKALKSAGYTIGSFGLKVEAPQ